MSITGIHLHFLVIDSIFCCQPPTQYKLTRPDPARTDSAWPTRPDPTRPDPTRPDPARADPAALNTGLQPKRNNREYNGKRRPLTGLNTWPNYSITWLNYPKAKYFDPTFSRNDREYDGKRRPLAGLNTWPNYSVTVSNYTKSKYFDPTLSRISSYTLGHAPIPN